MTSLKDDFLKKYQDLSKRKELLISRIEQLKGERKAAESALRDLLQDCKEKNINPSNLSTRIDELEQEIIEDLSKFQANLQKAENALEKFEQDRES